MIKYLLDATGIGLNSMIKYLRRTTSAAAGNGLGTKINYLRRAKSIVWRSYKEGSSGETRSAK
jgi:hypothetical protein